MSLRVLTIGGYGFSEEGFFAALQRASVDTFVDLRQRRGVRGSKYAFLNSKRLQERLHSLGIRYLYERELAPTTGVREAQRQEDESSGVGKRQRSQLSPAFIAKYRKEILEPWDPAPLLEALQEARVVVLFCVEGSPAACHRSLAGERLIQSLGGEQGMEHIEA